jgi:tannase
MMLIAVNFFVALAAAARLSELCTTEHVKASLEENLPSDIGISTRADSITANPVTDYTLSSGGGPPGTTASPPSGPSPKYAFCNVTFAYTHPETSSKVNVWYWLPDPEDFEGRFLATGGGGYAITSGQRSLSTGLPYGAVTGTTDGGMGSWSAQLPSKILKSDGVLDYDILFLFAYRAIHEMTVLGQQLTKNFYSADKVFSYYTGCSEGGREGLSQVQRYGSQFDGAVVGAPAIRFSQLQVLHLYTPLLEIKHGYVPSKCEVDRIVEHVIDACDALDGREDGVVSRADLCRLHYNALSAVGSEYSCKASPGGGGFPAGPPGPSEPAAKGKVSEEAVAIIQAIWDGMLDDEGRHIYVSFPPAAVPTYADGSYDAKSGSYKPTLLSLGTQWVKYFLEETKSSELSLDNATYDTLRDWVLEGIQKYSDTLQTNWPDLEDFRDAGGKLIHYHGESDNSIPAGSSILYYESVRKTMYPDLSFNESVSSMNHWYRFYMVSGAGHCGRSQTQPNGPFPDDALGSVIRWVEDGLIPERLNASVTSRDIEDKDQKLCSWPLRPYWEVDGTVMDCVYDQESLDTWTPEIDSVPLEFV